MKVKIHVSTGVGSTLQRKAGCFFVSELSAEESLRTESLRNARRPLSKTRAFPWKSPTQYLAEENKDPYGRIYNARLLPMIRLTLSINQQGTTTNRRHGKERGQRRHRLNPMMKTTLMR
jgi:hypothetical protein